MEDLCRKIPLISKNLLEELDDQSCVNFKDASREINAVLKNERFYWIRVLRSHSSLLRDFKDSWARVVNRTPAEFVKEIVVLIDQFGKLNFYTGAPTSYSPQHIAAFLGNLDLFHHFVVRTGDMHPKESDSGFTPMHLAAGYGKIELFKFILFNSDDKNPRAKFNVTPLHTAADAGQLEICRLIIENIQDKNPKDIHGRTPLFLAIAMGHLNLCKFIIENVPEKNFGDWHGQTLFHLAAERGYLAVCKLFIENMQDKNPRNNVGYTPLHYAACEGHLDICKLIIENVQNINPGGNNGNTPLHIAAESGEMDICKLIIESMQNQNSGSVEVKTPIQMRQKHGGDGHLRTFRYRKEKRSTNRPYTSDGLQSILDLPSTPKLITANPMNNLGITPLDRAKQFGYPNICEYINSVLNKENSTAEY